MSAEQARLAKAIELLRVISNEECALRSDLIAIREFLDREDDATPSPSMEGGDSYVPSGRDAPSDEHSRWLPIETAPKDESVVMLHGDGWTTMGWWDRYHDAWEDDRCPENQSDNWAFTHWQPLPTPPGEQAAADDTAGQAERSEDAPNSPSQKEIGE